MWQDPPFFFLGVPPGRGDPSDVAVHGTMSEPAEVAESDKASQEASRWGEDGGFHQVSWEACPNDLDISVYIYIIYIFYI